MRSAPLTWLTRREERGVDLEARTATGARTEEAMADIVDKVCVCVSAWSEECCEVTCDDHVGKDLHFQAG